MEIERIHRLLMMFHMFMCAQEVSVRYINDFFEANAGVTLNRKMIQRDMEYLKNIGLINYRYSRSKQAYIPQDMPDWYDPDEFHGDYPEHDDWYFVCIEYPKTLAELYEEGVIDDIEFDEGIPPYCIDTDSLEMKLMRMCMIITFAEPDCDPYVWYHDHFFRIPEQTLREELDILEHVGYYAEYNVSYTTGEPGHYSWHNYWAYYKDGFDIDLQSKPDIISLPKAPVKRRSVKKKTAAKKSNKKK